METLVKKVNEKEQEGDYLDLFSHNPATYFADEEVVHSNGNTFLQKKLLFYHQTCF